MIQNLPLTWPNHPTADGPIRSLGLCATNGSNGQVSGRRSGSRLERPMVLQATSKIDPTPSYIVLRSGHGNRSKPPLNSRQLCNLIFSDCRSARECEDYTPTRPATPRDSRRRGRSRPPPAARTGVRVRSTHRLVGADRHEIKTSRRSSWGDSSL